MWVYKIWQSTHTSSCCARWVFPQLSVLGHITHPYLKLAKTIYLSFLLLDKPSSVKGKSYAPHHSLYVLISYFSQFNHMVETHKRFSKQMLGQLQEVTDSHRRNLRRLEEQERNHKTFTHRSKCLTTLLEQDRERFVCQSFNIGINSFAKTTLIIFPTQIFWHTGKSQIGTLWCLFKRTLIVFSICEPVMFFITERKSKDLVSCYTFTI